ncbi:L,D-transpeptidase catalytic domain [Hymenobacter arizonensis]|uniref:L,D-transpeptidase catalytic domain n=2 Tax=Hymenobacter arizonensis TaxID=1227077 RepID=A0A1I5UIH5_HYMAR|nr:L,D-transpeptidase catalytic domain [Hymenobacter arizonensis]
MLLHFIRSRLAGALCVSLGLAGAGCGTAPGQVPAVASARPLVGVAPEPEPVSLLIRQQLRAVPAGEEAVRAFYDSTYAVAWTLPTGSLNPDAHATLALLARAPEHGLRPADYDVAGLQALRDSLQQPTLPLLQAGQRARLDVALSQAALRFGRDLGRGRLHPYTPTAKEKAAGAAGQPAALLRAALNRHAVPAALLANAPTNREYRLLQAALARWLAQPAAPDSAALRQRQFEQAAVNLERWRWEPLADSSYVLINVPAYELLVVAHDSVVRRHRVVVGAPGTRTPTLSSRLTHFTLAPDWHVPRSIATKEILPRLKKDAGYLARHNYALYDGQGRLVNATGVNWAAVTAQSFGYTIRQSAGCENALGNIVFRFANPYSVYVHDTPLRQYFAQPARALSHGCVRLENPLLLATYLLRREGNTARLPSDEECARQPRPRELRLVGPLLFTSATPPAPPKTAACVSCPMCTAATR